MRFWYIFVIQLIRTNLTFPKYLWQCLPYSFGVSKLPKMGFYSFKRPPPNWCQFQRPLMVGLNAKIWSRNSPLNLYLSSVVIAQRIERNYFKRDFFSFIEGRVRTLLSVPISWQKIRFNFYISVCQSISVKIVNTISKFQNFNILITERT